MVFLGKMGTIWPLHIPIYYCLFSLLMEKHYCLPWSLLTLWGYSIYILLQKDHHHKITCYTAPMSSEGELFHTHFLRVHPSLGMLPTPPPFYLACICQMAFNFFKYHCKSILSSTEHVELRPFSPLPV